MQRITFAGAILVVWVARAGWIPGALADGVGTGDMNDMIVREHTGNWKITDFPEDTRLDMTRRDLFERAKGHGLETFILDDLNMYFSNSGPMAAYRFLRQKSGDDIDAATLARHVFQWRKQWGINELNADSFPCDLFKMNFISELPRGAATGTPVIWIRLGAIEPMIKQIDSTYLKTGRMDKLRLKLKSSDNELEEIDNVTEKNRSTLKHILKAIVWWLDGWIVENPNTRVTLVLDSEETDIASSNSIVKEFFSKLDDRYPDLFERILNFRTKSSGSLNRFLKAHVSSSNKTKQVESASDLSKHLEGDAKIPDYVSGNCNGPDDSLAPAGCKTELTQTKGMYNPQFWQAINTEVYRNCKG